MLSACYKLVKEATGEEGELEQWNPQKMEREGSGSCEE